MLSPNAVEHALMGAGKPFEALTCQESEAMLLPAPHRNQ